MNLVGILVLNVFLFSVMVLYQFNFLYSLGFIFSIIVLVLLGEIDIEVILVMRENKVVEMNIYSMFNENTEIQLVFREC